MAVLHANAAMRAALLVLFTLSCQVSEARKCLPPTPKHRPPPPKHHLRAPPAPAAPKVTHSLTIFGDSLSDDGNEYARSGKLVPNPAFYYKGRLSNGPVWNEYMKSASGHQVTQVNNYAYSAACACQSLAQYDPLIGLSPATSQALAFHNQTDQYLSQRAVKSKGVLNTVVVIIGGHDVYNILTIVANGGSLAAAAAASREIVTCVVNGVAKLAASGETRIVVGNLPPADIAPIFDPVPASVKALLKSQLVLLNAALSAAVAALQVELGNATTLHMLDVDGVFRAAYIAAVAANQTTSHPCLTTMPLLSTSLYGALNPNVTTSECASKGAGYFFFDREFHTTTVHATLAAAFSAQFKAWGLY